MAGAPDVGEPVELPYQQVHVAADSGGENQSRQMSVGGDDEVLNTRASVSQEAADPLDQFRCPSGEFTNSEGRNRAN